MDENKNEPAKTVCEGKYLRMKVRGQWEYVERTHAGGLATIIVAVTPDDNILFVEQFRVPLQARSIEMPAGLVGDVDAGESIELSAARELEEETGWRPAHCEVLMIGPTSSGMSSERIAFVRATGLTKFHDGGGEASEDIIVHEVSRSEAPRWLAAKMAEGYEMDPKLWAGLWLVERNADGSPAM
jgi:ADP-ribose pyrophosphatase